MQNRKFDKWFEQIILVFAYFFLFLLYSIDLASLFWAVIVLLKGMPASGG